MQKDKRKTGFTLVEIIVSIMIIAVLTAVFVPKIVRYVEKTRIQKDDSQMADLTEAIRLASADKDVIDEVNDYATADNFVTFTDSGGEYGIAKKDGEYWAPDGYGYAMTITWNPNKERNGFDLATGIINDITWGNGSVGAQRTISSVKQCYFSEMSDKKLYSLVKAVMPEHIRITSGQYKNSSYTIFVILKSSSNRKFVEITGSWNGTNLEQNSNAANIVRPFPKSESVAEAVVSGTMLPKFDKYGLIGSGTLPDYKRCEHEYPEHGLTAVCRKCGAVKENHMCTSFDKDDLCEECGEREYDYIIEGCAKSDTNVLNITFPIDHSKAYRIEYETRYENIEGNCYVGWYELDKNKARITEKMSLGNKVTQTTLRRDLKKGDTEIYVDSLQNWEEKVKPDYTSEVRNGVAFWDYSNYNPGIYSRYIRDNLYSFFSAIDKNKNVIHLSVPWQYESHKKGTVISQIRSGGNYKYISVQYRRNSEDWEKHSNIFLQNQAPYTYDARKINEAAEYMKLVVLSDWLNGKTHSHADNLTPTTYLRNINIYQINEDGTEVLFYHSR